MYSSARAKTRAKAVYSSARVRARARLGTGVF